MITSVSSSLQEDVMEKSDKTPPGEAVCENPGKDTPPPAEDRVREIGGRDGPEPTRFNDWEKGGRCIDF